jgi:hypothetical protein
MRQIDDTVGFPVLDIDGILYIAISRNQGFHAGGFTGDNIALVIADINAIVTTYLQTLCRNL